MSGYRLHFCDDVGRLLECVDLDCQDDEAALELVEQLEDGRELEIWQDDRMVWWFPATRLEA